MGIQVPFLDIPTQNASLKTELQQAVEEIITNGRFILGPGVERFENHFAEYTGVQHCIGLNSGTSALHMALIAADVQAGDEVITTPATWISTSWAVSYVGAKPVFVDIEPGTYGLDPELVEQAITPRTKAILPVHLYGQAANVRALKEVADGHRLVLIEDAAQSHGAMVEGRKVGSIGHAGCFSFYPGKNLGAFGEGGCVVTNDDDFASRVRSLRDHAQRGRHNHVEIGFNTRMEGIQGAVLDVKLNHIDRWNAARRQNAQKYNELLADVAELELPTATDPLAHVWHLYVVKVNHPDRDTLRATLADKGIATGVHYPTPVPFQPVYSHLGYQRGDFPVSEDLMSRCLSLPMFPELTVEQIEYTCQVFKECLQPVYS
ncbi:MAG: DegT/DnrJ/EryC1/StrS family aminotransferase [Gemmataceae bacterium]